MTQHSDANNKISRRRRSVIWQGLLALIVLVVVVGLVTAHLFDGSKQSVNSTVAVSQSAKLPLTSTSQTNELQQLLDNWVALSRPSTPFRSGSSAAPN